MLNCKLRLASYCLSLAFPGLFHGALDHSGRAQELCLCLVHDQVGPIGAPAPRPQPGHNNCILLPHVKSRGRNTVLLLVK